MISFDYWLGWMDKTLVYHLMHGCILCPLFFLQLARFLALAWLYFAFLRSERWNESSQLINTIYISYHMVTFVQLLSLLSTNGVNHVNKTNSTRSSHCKKRYESNALT
jgi:hypothetical protein